MTIFPELLTGFRFIAAIGPLQIGFARVSGVMRQSDTEVYQEGGLNSCVHIFTKPVSAASTLTLEKGVYPGAWSPLYLVGESIGMPLVLLVLSTNGIPAKTYIFNGCVVKKWQISDLNAEENKLLVDTFELEYEEVTIL